MDEGDLSGSLVWFAEALQLDRNDGERARIHRVRLTETLHLGSRWRSSSPAVALMPQATWPQSTSNRAPKPGRLSNGSLRRSSFDHLNGRLPGTAARPFASPQPDSGCQSPGTSIGLRPLTMPMAGSINLGKPQHTERLLPRRNCLTLAATLPVRRRPIRHCRQFAMRRWWLNTGGPKQPSSSRDGWRRGRLSLTTGARTLWCRSIR
jgi:hypothetical protein